MSSSSKYTGFHQICTSFVAAVLLVGCYDADPRSVQGALDYATRALEAGDADKLYRVIDQRGRHAMISIVKDRQRAVALVRASYPPQEQPAALSALGDAAGVADGAALFAARCGAPCMAELSAQLGAPVEQIRDGVEMRVTTSRGTTLHMYAGKDSWYGLVWNTAALAQERDRASRDLAQIRQNAAVYGRRRALESSSGQLPSAR